MMKVGAAVVVAMTNTRKCHIDKIVLFSSTSLVKLDRPIFE